ncbi:MAG: hypothetical protein ABSA80_21215 [Terriglobales bacterium]
MLNEIARSGVLFTSDMCDSSACHEEMFVEMLTGRAMGSGRPMAPTIFEYVRKETSRPASDFWLIQPEGTFRHQRCDNKNYSYHPEYGVRYGAISVAVNEWCYTGKKVGQLSFMEQHVDANLFSSATDRRAVQEFVQQARDEDWFWPDMSCVPNPERDLQLNDCLALCIALEVLKRFAPLLIVVRLLGFDDAHGDHGYWSYKDPIEEYVDHISATDALIGSLWRHIQSSPYLQSTTALLIRPDCGRNSQVTIGRKLDHSHADIDVQRNWRIVAAPTCSKSHVINDPITRLDLCATVVHALTATDVCSSLAEPRYRIA